MDESTFNYLVWAWIGLALIIFPFQFKTTAPYGRHTRKGWGPLMDNRLGWMVMELVSLAGFAWFFLSGDLRSDINWFFFMCWMIHYVNRSFIFPFRTKTIGKQIPIAVVLMAVIFNSGNGFINGYFFGHLKNYDSTWMYDARFWIGFTLFWGGFIINQQSDNILISLREGSEKGYKIPKGGLFKWISCANHFGEIIQWSGFAAMTWSLPALSFAIWTAANLIPRAISHHRWYKSHFPDYPTERKALIPKVF